MLLLSRFCRHVLVSALLAASSPGICFANGYASETQYDGFQQVHLTLNDHPLQFDVPPVLIQDRTMVPIRALLEALGATVSWDQASQTAYAQYRGQQLKMPINGYVIYKDQQAYRMDVPIMLVHDRTLIPVRFVVQALGFQVDWDNVSQTAKIYSPPDPGGPSASGSSTSGSSTSGNAGSSTAGISTDGNSTPGISTDGNSTAGNSTARSLLTKDQLITVSADDPAVTTDQLQHIVDLLNTKQCFIKDAQDLGLSPQPGVHIRLAYEKTGYQKLLQDSGFSATSAIQTVEASNGVTEDKTITLPIQGVSDVSLVRTLAHELTHVLLNENLGSNIQSVPIWLNEGIAWHEGLKQGYANDGAAAEGYQTSMLEGLVEDQANGRLPSLVQDDTTLDNYESHGYAAVEWLLSKKGAAAFQHYFKEVSQGTDSAFQDAFGMTVSDLNTAVDQGLSVIPQTSDQGADITFSVDPAFKGVLFVGTIGNYPTYAVSSLSAGTHHLHLAADGTLTGDGSIQSLPVRSSSSTAAADGSKTILLFADPNAASGSDSMTLASLFISDAENYTYPIYGILRKSGVYMPLGVSGGKGMDFQLDTQNFESLTVQNLSTSTTVWPFQ